MKFIIIAILFAAVFTVNVQAGGDPGLLGGLLCGVGGLLGNILGDGDCHDPCQQPCPEQGQIPVEITPIRLNC